MDVELINHLRKLADKYETEDFIIGDPSWFMHQVNGDENQETMAFIASTLSYGSRKQFMPKIQILLDASEGRVAEWVKAKAYCQCLSDDDKCFYRLYTNRMMLRFFDSLRQMLLDYGSLFSAVKCNATDGISAIAFLCRYFAQYNTNVIPKDTTSPCKRLAMFLRWMVRTESPVDLGLWRFIDRRTLIIPLDTHVLQQSRQLKLVNSKSSSMRVAVALTNTLREAFPDDPTKGDFALFGLGVDNS